MTWRYPAVELVVAGRVAAVIIEVELDVGGVVGGTRSVVAGVEVEVVDGGTTGASTVTVVVDRVETEGGTVTGAEARP